MAVVRHKPYDRTSHDGQVVNWRTKAMILVAEDRLGEDIQLYQGSYEGSPAAASADTHNGGGALDIVTGANWRAVVKVLRAVGFDAWYRPYNWDGKGGVAHIHAIAHGDAEASRGAKNQMVAYANRKNGLLSNLDDNFPFHPDPPVTFDFGKWQNTRILTLRVKRLLRRRARTNEQIAEARRAIRRIKH